jgi:dihydrofolate reductase
MARLLYSAIASLDLYTADPEGDFSWAAPDAEVHAFVNDMERPVGTYLYGRRMYETMVFWENPDLLRDDQPAIADYAAIWQAAEKVVYSTTLGAPTGARTRVERAFDPDAVARLKAQATSDLGIGGPTLAAAALAAGLVDEVHLLLAPVVIGGGTPALPDGLRLDLELIAERRFASGFALLAYRIRR